jgi:hypothetical protein
MHVERLQQALHSLRLLKHPNPLGVGRADVQLHRLRQRLQYPVTGDEPTFVQGRDADQHRRWPVTQTAEAGGYGRHAMTGKAHAVDQGLPVRVAEQPRSRIPRLGLRHHSAADNVAESQMTQARQVLALLIVACCQPHGVVEINTRHGAGERGLFHPHPRSQQAPNRPDRQRRLGEPLGTLGRHPEQPWPHESAIPGEGHPSILTIGNNR